MDHDAATIPVLIADGQSGRHVAGFALAQSPL
jgi:hypothetical protein